MSIQYFIRVLFYTAVVALIIGCTSTTTSSGSSLVVDGSASNQEDLQAVYWKLDKTNGRVFSINPKLSFIKIYAFRGGIAPTAGHNHVLSSPEFTGFVYLPNEGTSNARFDLKFRLDQLEIDNPENRSNLGDAFASTPSLGAIKHTRDHMLGEDNLQASRFPFVHIRSAYVAGEIPKLAVEVLIELHGQEQKMLLPINVEISPDHLSAKGAFVIRQSDFGIKPYSVLGGFLAVQNEVLIEFSLVGTQLMEAGRN
jgi:hypothetical protein